MYNQPTIVDKVAFIICFRESTEDRKNALQFVLNWLNKILPDIEILIIEQDEQPRLSLKLPSNCKKVFIYNPGLFNRSWAFNVALNHTTKEILTFSDADAVLTKKDYLACFEACTQFDAVTPNARMALNINQINLDTLDFKTTDYRYISFASMLMIITRIGLEKIGGWDERFEGWGYEDIVLGHLILNRLKTKSFSHTIFHVDHERTVFDGETQPQYQFNKKLFQEICLFSGASLNRYCDIRQIPEKGNPDKYTLSKTTKHPVIAKPTFVLGLLTLNQLILVKKFINNWDQYRSKAANWTLIIIDDGSNKTLLNYLDNLTLNQTELIIIKNNNRGIGHSFNVLFQRLTTLSYDLAFVCQPAIYFKQSNWENLYWHLIKRTGLGLLVYQKETFAKMEQVNKIGFFSSMNNINLLQPYFFTITPQIIATIGFMDNQYLGFSEIVFQEYFLRCCREGYNFSYQPLDADTSNDFIGVYEAEELRDNSEDKMFSRKLNPFLKNWHANLFRLNRTYLAWNEVEMTFTAYRKIMEERFPKLKSSKSILNEQQVYQTDN